MKPARGPSSTKQDEFSCLPVQPITLTRISCGGIAKTASRPEWDYSHSIIFSHGNALIFRCKFFLRTTKNRLTDPSEICALEFKHEFRRFTICSVSTTIGVNRSIFAIHGSEPRSAAHQKKTVSSLFCFPRFKLPPVVYDLTHFPGLVELVRRECPQLTLHQ